jgi:hypothetical protein
MYRLATKKILINWMARKLTKTMLPLEVLIDQENTREMTQRNTATAMNSSDTYNREELT